MPWIKQGRIIFLGEAANRSTHMQVPTPLVMEDRVRLYYACRNRGHSFPAFVDLDRGDLSKIIRAHESPVMELGMPGMFDSDGIMPSCIVPNGKELWMYYTGWNARGSGARYHNATGLAVSHDGGETFCHKFIGPILDRTNIEHGLQVTPFVINENGRWRMWYISGISWNKIGDRYEPVYVIRYAESVDGISWNRNNPISIPQSYAMEAFSNPCVIRKNDSHHMWYCYRHSSDYRDGTGSYRIGYAKSDDGTNWRRMDDESGIETSDSGWDSTMICYPYVIELDGRLIMFYNGNSFGQTGIGYAVWEGDLP